jgi:hypothetical protein
MKRLVLASLTLVLAAASAGAQGLTMGTMNGWTFTFSGNVNAFVVYTDPKCSDGSTECDFLGSTIPTGQEEKVLRVRTGLAPAFAIFEAKGKEGNFDIGVHFGFAPEIQTTYQQHDNCGGYGGCGSQIDMREVYLTFGGQWGQILAGRALGVYQGENLLTDMTVFGVGLSGGGGGKVTGGNGTTLGHIGTGYTYPNFNAQITYSTPTNKPGVFSIGLFDPSIIFGDNNFSQCCFDVTRTPRLEASFQWTKHMGASGSADKFMFYVSGLLANNKNDQSGSTCYPGPFTCKSSVSPWGLAGGVEWNGGGGWQADLSGFTQKGVGTTLMFDDGLAVDAAGKGRSSYGYLLQLQYAMKNNMWKFGASYGLNHLSQTSNDTDGNACDGDCPFVKTNSSIVAAVTYMFTKSLRGVFEYTYGSSEQQDGDKITSSQAASGLMLFF